MKLLSICHTHSPNSPYRCLIRPTSQVLANSVISCETLVNAYLESLQIIIFTLCNVLR